MSKKNLSKLLAALLSVMMVVTLFSGCTGGGSSANQSLIYNLGSEPQTIDPALNTAVDGGIVITAAFEGLTRLDEKSAVKPGVAEKWDVSADKLTYTFHLRKNAKWSDGKAVTAKDFQYAWLRALDPKTEAEYCYQLFYIKNAENFYNGKAKAEEVGIKVVDENTLEVKLEAPTPYFLELCAFATLMPVRQDMVEKDPKGWARNMETYIGNGPFKVTKYTSKDAIEFEKNKEYWDNKNIKMGKMTFVMVVEASSALASFEKGEIDLIESPPTAEIPRLQKENKLQINPYLGTYFVVFNNQKAPFDNPKVRQALNLAIDRPQIIDAVLKAGQKPATAFVPNGILDGDGKTDFRSKKAEYYKPAGDIEQAKKLLAEAGYPDGKGFPEVTYLYNTSEGHKKIAEALQDMWKKNLGINVKLANQEWAVFQKSRQNGDYQIARHGWIGDYMDPMTFLDMWLKGGGNNDAKYDNPEYDKLIKQAKGELDSAKRMDLLHQAEDVIMADMPFAPIYFYVNTMCVNPKLKGVVKTPLGTIYFDHATMEK